MQVGDQFIMLLSKFAKPLVKLVSILTGMTYTYLVADHLQFFISATFPCGDGLF